MDQKKYMSLEAQRIYDVMIKGYIEEKVTGVNSSVSYDCVRYDTEQNLTDEQKAQVRENIGIDISGDVHKNYLDECVYEWDGSTANKNSFTFGSDVYYKVSDDIPNLYWDYAFVEACMSDGTKIISDKQDGECCYMACGAIIVELAGECTVSSVTFTAPSSGVYFPHNEHAHMTRLHGHPSVGNSLLLRGSDGSEYSLGIFGGINYVVVRDDTGETVTLVNENTLTSRLEGKLDVPNTAKIDQILSIESIDDGVIRVKAIDNIRIDPDLSTSGVAADAKMTGDAIAGLNELVGTTSVSQQISTAIRDAIVEVYVQDTAPEDAPEDALWIDTSESGLPERQRTAANVYVADLATTDITTVDFSKYEIGDVVLVTSS